MKNINKVKLTIFSMALAAAVIALSVGSGFANSATPAAFQDGKAIYEAKCAKCHGADGKGVDKFKKQGVKDMTDPNWQKAHSDAKIKADINNGKGDFMPAWKGKLKSAEINAVVQHIRKLAKK